MLLALALYSIRIDKRHTLPRKPRSLGPTTAGKQHTTNTATASKAMSRSELSELSFKVVSV